MCVTLPSLLSKTFSMRKRSVVRKSIIFISFSFITNCTMAQSNDDPGSARALYDTIYLMDSIFFQAFNTCDTSKAKSLFTKDLEFYHDAGGLTNYTQNLESIRYRCNSKTKVRRELVTGSLEVHPIKDYGAIEIGDIVSIIRPMVRVSNWMVPFVLFTFGYIKIMHGRFPG